MLIGDSDFLIKFIALIISISVHEASHAFAAYKMGDPTAKYAGRLTLNPLAHLSFLGTVMILFAPIGWGKPVAYNPQNFFNYKWGTIVTALAGPFSNFILAFLAAIPLKYVEFGQNVLLPNFLAYFFLLNIMLLVFNLLPIPPLDGSKIALIFIPKRFHFQYENWMNEGGLKYFVLIFLLDFFIQKYTGYSFLGDILSFLALPVITLINFGI